MTSLKKVKISTVCSMPSALGLVWLSPSIYLSTKTKTIVLSTSQMSRVHSLGLFIPSLGISSRSLERVNLTKLLGIHFSEHLSWEDCMSTNCQKSCHSALGILRKIKNFTRNTYLAITLAKLKLSPVRLGTGWVTNIVLKVPTCSFFLSFFLISVLSKLKRTLEKDKQIRLRSETYRQLLFYLDFRSLVSWSY